jgi:hypothetical protein
VAGHFVDENGNAVPSTSTENVVITKALTSLDALHLSPTEYVGDALPTVTALTRVSVPTGAVVGETVVFTLTDAAGVSTQLTGTLCAVRCCIERFR